MEGKEKNKRLSVNAINLFVTCLFLFFAVQFSDGGGGFATKINRITENLNEAVLDLDQDVNYTDFIDTSEYISSTAFSARGMAGLYNLTRLFVDDIVPEDILMDDFLYFDANNQIQGNVPDPANTAYYYRKLVAVVSFLVLCIVFFPLCGLCFCCCRCCGRCGARSEPADKKKDTCKKIFLGSLLIVFGTGLLFCVVCAFGSNQQLQDGIDNFPSNMRNSLADTKTFLRSTNKQVNHLLVENYVEFTSAFLTTMNSSAQIISDQLDAYSNATAMTELYNFTVNLDTVEKRLTSLKENSNKLRVYASQLNDALRKVKRDLLNTLNICNISDCLAIRNNISTLSTNIDFDALPDVSKDLDSFDTLNITKIKNLATDGQAQLTNIQTSIAAQLDDGLTSAELQINNSATTITTNLNSVTDAVNDINNNIDDSTSQILDDAQRYIDEYGKYRYYGGLAVSCVLLLVTICIALGLICGICGKRPDGYSDNCCNKGAGSQFLLCAVMIMFLFGFIIAVITAVSLVVGVISEKAVCDPIRDPDPNKFRIIQLLDSYDLKLNINPSNVLSNCYNNKSAYKTFNLQDKFNLDEIIAKFDIDAELNKINVSGIIGTNFTILSSDDFEILKNSLLTFVPSADLEKFSDELNNSKFTNYRLTELSDQLELIISKPEVNNLPVKASLQLSVLHLNTYNDKLLLPMQRLAEELVDNAIKLNSDLNMGKESFHVAVEDLIEEIQNAEKYLQTNGSARLVEVANTFISVVTNQTKGYIDRVSHMIQNEVGSCGPLSQVINATLISTCNKVLMPWNGFWFSLFWTAILYVIVIIISIKLANLYQKYKPYGQYVETEYLYDAYADRGDNIPLNSRGAKRGKKKGKKGKRYEERPIGSEVAREYAASSRPPDGRYADMAPNLGNQNQSPYYHEPRKPYYNGPQGLYFDWSKSPFNGGPSNSHDRPRNRHYEEPSSYLAGPQNPFGRSDKNDNNVKSTRHWEEFPNGGPPHYQRAPTEYERPPPYYYPGSGGEQ